MTYMPSKFQKVPLCPSSKFLLPVHHYRRHPLILAVCPVHESFSTPLATLPWRLPEPQARGRRSSFPARQPADLPEHSRRTSLRDLRSSPACGRWSSPLGRRTSPSPAEPLLAAAEARSPPGVTRGKWSSLVGRRTSPSPAKLLLAAAEAWSPPGVVRGRWSSPTTGRRTTSARPADLPWWRTELHTCAAGGACRRAAAGLAGGVLAGGGDWRG